ncbi:heterokaryon incompatibility protein (HET) domain-containing protein [Trichoderma breve]|uniref:Heterokaryon incompatibility protein (HET) domain-containing protein n=1 Tax=Trichoderma breve TaxID=2034170 RepID=A0A9W9BFS7_9HYPO|nr:heterokaryon incompatibility protein (HET) domain-containing protein [Trichoderma breve]KAJ4862542.1 heterokaryon incompatibility protein (HET) domain-containing protein [Trichoderma breve]
MVSYTHIPLTLTRSIRLIHLEAAAHLTDDLRCTLAEVALDSNPVYKALSYSWDAQTPSHPIECDGATLLITQNCMAALRRLRSMDDLTLWIDGICIDQTSIAERSAQVALMRDIYKQAAEVIVWLGEEDEPSKRAIGCLEDIALMSVDKERMERCLPILLGLQRSWFSRMWTIQEVALPSQQLVRVLCGSVSLPWLYLAIALDMLRASDYKWGDWHSAMRLQAYLKKKCTDPKDRIFALFGIFEELDIIVPAPDYSETLGRIYAAATVACFTNDSCMEFLYHVPSENRRAGLPSWTVDWGDAAWIAADQRVTVTKKPFTASGMSSPSLQFSENTLRIQIQGSIVDRVRQVGQPLSVKSRQHSAINERLVWDGLRMEANNGWNLDDTAEDIHAAFEVFTSWVDLASSARSHSNGKDAENSRYALCETLLEYHSSKEAEQEIVNLKSSFWPWLEAIQAYASTTMQQKHTPPRSSTALQSFFTLTKGEGSRFQLKIMITCQRKRFITTENREIRLIPDIVQVGDIVALISGLHMPVILRPVDQGRFLYVCHAYIHGLMGGEKWDKSAKVGIWLT